MLSKYLQLLSCNMAKAVSAGLLTSSYNGFPKIRHCQIVALSDVHRAYPTKSWQSLQLTGWAPLVTAPELAVQAADLCTTFRRHPKRFSSIAQPALPDRPLASDLNGAEHSNRIEGNEHASGERVASRLIRQSGKLAAPLGHSIEEVGGMFQAGKQALELPPASRKRMQEHALVEAEKAKKPSPLITVTKPLPRVLILHTGGTLGMDPDLSFEKDRGRVHLREGTGGTYKKSLQPRGLLADLLAVVPELQHFANLDVRVVFNKDSCRVGPSDWVRLAKILHQQRNSFSAFIVVHGTDTMAYTASALSLMLAGFQKPIVLTGSQLPLSMPRSDARQNLIDSISCATSGPLAEVCICFGGVLLRGNRAQKSNASVYRAFSSATYPHLANLGLEVEWDKKALLKHEGVYRPRFELNPNVIRIPIVPGCDPRAAYGDLWTRGVRGLVLEAFGVGNMPDTPSHGWLPWLRQQRKAGMQVYLSTQCDVGYLHPELYRSGSIAVALGVEAGPQMTPECACCKMMLCLEYPDIPLGQPIAGEL